jgi:hypothetical protein
MTSSDLINHYKLVARIQHDHTVQLIHKSDPINGRRKVTIEKRWHKVKRLGQGAYGVVYLEREETNGVESQRAVKQVPKLLQSGATVDYSRELSAMAILSKVKLPKKTCHVDNSHVSWCSCVATATAGL